MIAAKLSSLTRSPQSHTRDRSHCRLLAAQDDQEVLEALKDQKAQKAQREQEVLED